MYTLAWIDKRLTTLLREKGQKRGMAYANKHNIYDTVEREFFSSEKGALEYAAALLETREKVTLIYPSTEKRFINRSSEYAPAF